MAASSKRCIPVSRLSEGKWVRDIERGVAEGISAEAWQTDTSIGDWYYRTGQKYKTSGEIVRMLADIVSKNSICSSTSCKLRRGTWNRTC